MHTARTLEPGDHLSHYYVVGPLGAGGMGEVYLARDQDLERNVAIKILPPDVVRNEERLRRFVLEAKSASSLNHPSIVTIYEIGKSRVESASGAATDPDSASVHFISMELVTGKTVSNLIHDEKTDLRTLLGFLAQAADGLAKAHAAGIVHRDLKPGNIMVTTDGFAKVLDFGLAKLTEKRPVDGDLSTAATVVADETGEGVVLGTAGYMSPEQVQSKPVDHRSDIFSFGSILYEAATTKQPFRAESSIETMHRILNDRPAPVEELNPKVPSEVRRLIRRCLSKNPEQRFQSMKDLSIELREIVDEYDSLSPSGSSTTAVSTAAPPVPPARRIPAWALWGTGVAIVAIGVTVFILRRGAQISAGPSPDLRMTTVTSRGDATEAVLSPDGRFVASVIGSEGQRALWVRQVATGSDVQVLRQQSVPIAGLTFSPDGNYLYYLGTDVEHPGYKALFRVPTLGGSPVRIVYDIDTAISFAPDGRHVCFARGIPAKQLVSIIDMDLENSQERTITSIKLPRLPQAFPKWSPRGDRIAIAESDSIATLGIRVVTYRVSDARREVVKAGPWPRMAGLTWAADGRGLLVAGIDLSGSPAMQISYVPVPSGPVRKVTHDINQYGSPSISADGKTIATLRNVRSANLWIAPLEEKGGEPRPLTATTGAEDAIGLFAPGDAGDVLFTSLIGQYVHLSTIRLDGSAQRALSTGQVYVIAFRPVTGGAVTMQVGEDRIPHLWRLERDTGAQTQLTRGPGERVEAASRDGKLIAYTRIDAPHRLLVIPVEGGEPRTLVEDFETTAEFSPDGQRLRYRALRTVDGRPIFTTIVCMTATGAPDSIPVVPRPVAGLQWSPVGQAFSFEDRADSAWNVCRRPIHGGPVERLTHFTDRRVTGHSWSPDGRWLLMTVQSGNQRNLWIAGSDGQSPRPLTNFRMGTTFGVDCTPDSKNAVVSYGNASQDVVLIQGFK